MKIAQQTLAIFLSFLMVWSTIGCGPKQVQAPAPPLAPTVFNPLQQALQKGYLELFEEAPSLEFTQQQIDQMRQFLEGAKDYCKGKFESRAQNLGDQLDQAQERLKKASADMTEEQRHNQHCSIQNLRALKSQAELLANQGIPVAYENKEAKLKLIEQWPAELKQIQQALESGSYHNRRWGDVKDIGFREFEKGQQDDIDDGREAIEEMRRNGLLPPEIKNQAVKDYVNTLGQKIAKHSDLHIPLHVFVLDSKEINAFALPGGFLFVQRGLLERAEDESQLAGVMAHEIAHIAARHGHKLSQKATISQLIFQAAQVAAILLTGGAAGIGTLYALRYGFYGLGLVLSLNLLGVSRDYELEADQLGVQYSWASGYDPTGFIRFFDKMATREGYVDGVSWFRTHPPFYERMVQSMREIKFLPEKEDLVVNTTEFKKMKEELAKVTARAKEEEEGKPSLKMPEPGCPPPDKLEYKPGEPIEEICPIPGTQQPSQRAASAQ